MTSSGQTLIVAIDGPAGSGKSTVARRVARELGATFLDTGAIYRSLALCAREQRVDWDDGAGLARLASSLPLEFAATDGADRVLLAGEDVSEAIRAPDISRGASAVSRHPAVREALIAMQRRFADAGAVVAEGRDIGTVVFPSAGVKVFLVADPSERARRRHAQLRAAGGDVTFAQVLAEQRARDEADASRAVAPLRPAADAVTLDTTGLDIDQVVARILAMVPATRQKEREPTDGTR